MFSDSQLTASLRATHFEHVFLCASQLMDTEQLKKNIITSYENDDLAIKVSTNLDSEEYASWTQSDSGLLRHKAVSTYPTPTIYTYEYSVRNMITCWPVTPDKTKPTKR